MSVCTARAFTSSQAACSLRNHTFLIASLLSAHPSAAYSTTVLLSTCTPMAHTCHTDNHCCSSSARYCAMHNMLDRCRLDRRAIKEQQCYLRCKYGMHLCYSASSIATQQLGFRDFQTSAPHADLQVLMSIFALPSLHLSLSSTVATLLSSQ